MNKIQKIGILTFHRALNYGAVWQCWALGKACESFGHDVETIDYNPFGDFKYRWFIGRRPSTTYWYWMRMFLFDRFIHRCLRMTDHTESYEWIKKNPPQKDIYLVGSDTVWSNQITGKFMDSYLLDFAPADVKRISYAASSGANPMELNEYQLGELRKFSAISVRERQSVADVQAKVDVPVVDVCDPTLLLKREEYEVIEKKPLWLPKHYMVYFDLVGDPFCVETAKLIGKSLNLLVLNLAGKYKHWARYNYMTPTPEQWLYILHHADYICTNSFHGTAFSIIYRRPFVCCAAKIRERAKTNGRVQNMLMQTNLKDRYVASIDGARKIIEQEIKFDDSAIEAYRSRSLQWLKNAIDNETDKE